MRQRAKRDLLKSHHVSVNSSQTSDLEQGNFPVGYNKVFQVLFFKQKQHFFSLRTQQPLTAPASRVVTLNGWKDERLLNSQASMQGKF